MKELRRLENSVSFLCGVHLALLTLCLSLAVALLYPGDDPAVCVLWAFGAVVPVQIIHQICVRCSDKLLRVLLCAAVTLAAALLPNDSLRRFYYVLCCVPILIAGLLLNRPGGRIVLTVPKSYHLLAFLMLYALGRIIHSSLMSGLALVLLGLMSLTYFVYRNQNKLLSAFREAAKEEVAHRSIILLNRRVMVMFAVLGLLLLAAIPWLLQRQEPQAAPEETLELGTFAAASAVQTMESVTDLPENLVITTAGEPLEYSGVGNVLMWVFVGVIGCILLLILFAWVLGLLSISNSDPKHADPEREQSWTLERLEPEKLRKDAEEPAVGYEKKLRRRYQKLIRGRSSGKAKLSSMTPEELERAAKLEGPGADTVHKLYEQTRYGPGPTDKERYTAFREAERSLDPPKHETQESG